MNISPTLVDMPREQLIGWIAKQLSLGVRGGTPMSPADQVESLSKQLSELHANKKKIVQLSKDVSNLVHAAISEAWKSVELEGQLIATSSAAELDAFSENTLPSVWEHIKAMYEEDIRTRAEEDKLREAAGGVTLNTSGKCKAAIEQYLHERYLVKKQQETRSAIEKELRERMAKLSGDLHTMKDFGRVKEAVMAQERAHQEDQMDMDQRQQEWRLMEEEANLVRAIDGAKEKGEQKCERMRSALSRLNQTYILEKDYLREKEERTKYFKGEISKFRMDVRNIETAISKFRSYLRHEDKVRRNEDMAASFRD